MYKTVFILGAGASVDAGCPTMADFLDKARDFHSSNVLTKKQSLYFGEVFEAIHRLKGVSFYSNFDLNNIEYVLSAFDMGRQIKRLGDIPVSKIGKLNKFMQQLIGNTIELSTNFRQRGDGTTVVKGSYHRLATVATNILNKKPNGAAIITFNYDLAADYALHYHSIGVNYHLGHDTSENKLPLLKLHGSLNWGYQKETGSIYGIPMADVWHFVKLTGRGETKQLLLTKHFDDGEIFSLRGSSGPIIVPPTWSKSEHQHKVRKVWEKAAEVLSEAEAIYVIGYSLPETDLFFQYLFSLSTHSESSLRRFWVFDPNPAIKDRFFNMLGQGINKEPRFHYEKTDFQGAVAYINDRL